MPSLVLALGLGIMLGLALVPHARTLALRVGLVDRPDGRRKMHGRVIPVSGGLAVFATTWLVLAAAVFLPHPLQESLAGAHDLLLGLFLAGALIVAVGVADDLGYLRGRHKLVGQVAAVLLVMRCGVHVQQVQLLGWTIELGIFAGVFTCFLLLAAINSINLIDGMDGLLGSVGAWLALSVALMAWAAGQEWAAVVALALAGALVAFLRYNLPPASVFLGDAGSMLVGLTLGTLAIRCSLRAPASVDILRPIGLLTVPFFDTAAAIVRRKLTGRSIYTTDRGHLHHCLLRHGYSVRRVLALVSACCVVTCGGVLASQALDSDLLALLASGAVVAALIRTRLFGHAELMLVRERVLSVLRPGPARQMEVRLQGSADWGQLWLHLTGTAERLNLQQMALDVNAPALHEGYHARWDCAADGDEVPAQWRVTIPLAARGQAIGRLEIGGAPDGAPVWAKVAAVTQLVEAYTDSGKSPEERSDSRGL